jgi:ribonuclease HI/pterin-4a-carbinolamine dehydratase
MTEQTSWQETKHGLYKQFNFDDFAQAFAFMIEVAEIAERENHHPRWENAWSVVQLWLISHDAGGKITAKDRQMAELIDAVVAPGKVAQATTGDATVTYDKVKLYGDGGSRGNPGPSASGYVVLDMDNNVLVDEGVYLGITTNNQAEYTSLKLALEQAKKLGAKEVDVYMDSLLVVNQMKGIFKVKNRDLWPIYESIKQYVSDNFKHVSYTHVPRELNKLADAAVNRALDAQISAGDERKVV